MLTRWNAGWSDFDDVFSTLDQMRHFMDRVFDDSVGRPEARTRPRLGASWPRANLIDAGTSLVVTAEVPGLGEKDVKITLNQDVLTVSGERKTHAPAGYSVHRQERPPVAFSRSFALPCRVNPERATASVKNGILTITLEKATEAMPRQITVKAQ